MQYINAPLGTLGRILKGKAFTAHIDRSNASLFDVAETISKSGLMNEDFASPEQHALKFYLYNQASAVITHGRDMLEPATDAEADILSTYVTQSSLIAVRLFWYILLISSREARHNKSPVGIDVTPIYDTVKEAHPDVKLSEVEAMVGFTRNFPDSTAILSKLMEEHTKGFRMGPYCKTLSALYYQHDWDSSFGGPKWGAIADALHSFVTGEWSAEIFTDTAFTLAHNTAPIFNKGMLYDVNGAYFIEILDVQRAGMIPQWVSTDSNATSYITGDINVLMEAMPHMFAGEVDWNRVEELGAINHYLHKPGYKAAQKSTAFTPKSIAVDAVTVVSTKERA